MSVKIYEAREHVKAAEKYLKTNLLRWKPDLDSAADEYSQAAQCYRIARDMIHSKECHMKAHDLYKQIGSLFHAGKSIESALLVAKDVLSPEEVYHLATSASSLYQQHGSGDSGAVILEKGGKILEDKSPELACKLFQQAADVSATQSSQHQGTDYIAKASRILVKMRRYEEALESMRKEVEWHLEAGNIGAVGRLTVAAVLVHLARADPIAAEKIYKEWGSNCELAEVYTLEQLLQAYDEDDRDSAQRALASPFIRNMDVEYARLASIVPLPRPMTPASKAATSSKMTVQSYASARSQRAAEAVPIDGEPSHQDPDPDPEGHCSEHKCDDNEEQLC